MLIEELQIGNYVNHNNEVIIVDSISESVSKFTLFINR